MKICILVWPLVIYSPCVYENSCQWVWQFPWYMFLTTSDFRLVSFFVQLEPSHLLSWESSSAKEYGYFQFANVYMTMLVVSLLELASWSDLYMLWADTSFVFLDAGGIFTYFLFCVLVSCFVWQQFLQGYEEIDRGLQQTCIWQVLVIFTSLKS
jgi:hypothetical protein